MSVSKAFPDPSPDKGDSAMRRPLLVSIVFLAVMLSTPLALADCPSRKRMVPRTAGLGALAGRECHGIGAIQSSVTLDAWDGA